MVALLLDFSVKKWRRWAPTEVVLRRMWATGNAAGGLPLSVETPSEIVGWPVSFSLRLSKDLALTQQLVTATMAADGSDIKNLTTPFWGVARSGYTRDGQHILWETQQAGFVW